MAGRDTEPYVGPRPFEPADAARFFGRDEESRKIESLLYANRLIILYGRSGAGKTSLLNAGLLPRLSEDTAQVLPVSRTAQMSTVPTASTPDFNPFSRSVLTYWSSLVPGMSLEQLTIKEFLQELPVRLDEYDDPLPLVAIIDGFDETFTYVPQWERKREEFLAELADAVEGVPRLRLLLVTSEDAIGQLLPWESALSGGYRARYQVRSLLPKAALDAVTGPTEGTGRWYAPSVAEALVESLHRTTVTNALGDQTTVVSERIDPIHLQIVCYALWRDLPEDVTEITSNHLRVYGNSRAALRAFYTEAVRAVAAEAGRDEAAVWSWLEDTFITEHATRGIAYAGINETRGMPNAVAEALEGRGILRSQPRAGSVWFELLSDGLIEIIQQGVRVNPQPAEIRPTKPDAYLGMAQTALADGDFHLAGELALRAVEESDDDLGTRAEAEAFLGRVYYQRGQVAGPDAPEFFNQAQLHFGRSAGMFEVLQRPVAVGKLLAEISRIDRALGRYSAAVSRMNSAVARAPGDNDLQLELASALRDAGDVDSAAAIYTALLSAAPGNVESLVGRGSIAAISGDPAAALADLETAVRLRPGLAERPDVARSRSLAQQRGAQLSDPDS